MANAEIAKVGAIEQLTERLRSFESAGLPKPPNYLLSDYLRFLVDQELLPLETSVNVQAIYNNSRYGHAHIDAEVLAKTVAQLDVAGEALRELDPPAIEALAKKLAGSPVSAETPLRVFGRSPVSSTLATPVRAPDVPTWEGSEIAADFARLMPSPNPQTRYLSRIIVCGFLWTIIVLAAGYFGHDKVSSAFQQERKTIPRPMDFRQARQNRQQFIEVQRAAIAAAETDEDRAQMMRDLAQTHFARREYAEYYFIYESLLIRDPNNAHDKDKMAAFLLSTTNSWYRDPVRARQLAEEAVAADPDPNYLHTLAEAMYQTGEPQRAAELQRQAIDANAEIRPRARRYFYEHLRRFRRATEAESIRTTGGVAPVSTN